MMKKSLLFSLLLVVLFSCSKETDEIDIEIPKGRTILVYIAGDDSYSGISTEVEDMKAEIMKGWNSEIDGSLIIYVDSWTTYPVLVKVNENNGETVLDTLEIYKGMYDNENSASPALFKKVLHDTKKYAPSKSYGLILFSHATGWLPANAFGKLEEWQTVLDTKSMIRPRSVFYDRGREMELADFAEAIPDGMFDFIASEMCFMASVETAYALRNKTNFLLASAPEVLSPGFAPIYESSLHLLFKPKADLEGFAQEFFDYFDKLKGEPHIRSAAISVVRTSEMEPLATLTREIAPSLTQEEIDRVLFYDRNGKPHVFFDFLDYIHKAATPTQYERMKRLLDKAVIFKRNTTKLIDIYIEGHSGLSVYIPQTSLQRLNEAYQETDWAKAIKK